MSRSRTSKSGVEIYWNDIEFNEILKGYEIRGLEKRVAEQIAGLVRSIAASTPFEKSTGRYANSVTVEEWVGPTRVSALVRVAVPYATKVEARWGILSRAIASCGAF